MRRFYVRVLIALVALAVSAGVCDAARRGRKPRVPQKPRVSHRLPIHKTSLVIMPFDYGTAEEAAPAAMPAAMPPAVPAAAAATAGAEVKAPEGAPPVPPVFGEVKPIEGSAVGAKAAADYALAEEQRKKDVGLAVAVGLRDSLAGNDIYSVYVFSDKLSPIRRAVELDGLLKRSEIRPPFSDDKDRVLKIARILASDLVLTGSIDTLTIDLANKIGRATLSGQLLDVKTGRIVKAFVMVEGKAPVGTVAVDEDDMRAVVVASLVGELKTQFLGEEAGETGAAK